MRPGEPEVGGEHVEPPLVERLAEGPGVRDHLAGVVAPEGEVLGEGDAEGRHRVKVVVARHAGERPRPQAFLDVGVRGLGEEDPVLGARERLVGRGGEDLAPLVERVLELPAGDQAEDVGGVVPPAGPDLLEGRGELADRHRKEEEREPEQAELRPGLLEDRPGLRDVDRHPLLVPGVVDGVHPPHPERAEGGARDVGPIGEPRRSDRLAGFGEGFQDGEVGDRPGDRADVGEGATEEAAREVEADPLDPIDLLVPLVVALAGEPLGVPGVEIADHELLRIRGEEVLGGDQGDRTLEANGVPPDRLPDLLDRPGERPFLGTGRGRDRGGHTPPPPRCEWNFAPWLARAANTRRPFRPHRLIDRRRSRAGRL